MRRSPDDTVPEYRRLRIYAIHPMVSRAGEHQVTVRVRYEPLALGNTKATPPGKVPVSLCGRRLEVVDVDASGPEPVWLLPINLDDANIAMQHGLEPSETDPQFHQQMVYAVAMSTLEQFDRALGRVVYFRGMRRLRLVPHAFRGGNAFYHPGLRAVLFGYFRASEDSPGENLPGQLIFTCASHDIVAHEVTHAVVDCLRPFFNVATNPHVRAFHEGFADLVAVFQRLSFRELVQPALQDVQGDVRQSELLSNIAAQFGQGLGGGRALRSALDVRTKIQDVAEEHALGAVLVAAIFEGFYKTYERRTADLVRIATGGTGVLPSGALHPDLVARLTGECVRTAQSVLTMCIRAFDYLPPADVTFGTFLRALVTADWELNPLDEIGLRAAIIEACRQRGIFAAEAGSLAVNALLLDHARAKDWARHRDEFKRWVDLAIMMGVEQQRSPTPDDEGAVWTDGPRLRSRTEQAPPVKSDAAPDEEETVRSQELRKLIARWFSGLPEEERARFGMERSNVLRTTLFHPSQRVATDGAQRFGLVVQLVQTETVTIRGVAREFPTGATLVIDVTGNVRFVVVAKSAESRRAAMEATAERAMTDGLGWTLDDPPDDPFAVDYRGMHEART